MASLQKSFLQKRQSLQDTSLIVLKPKKLIVKYLPTQRDLQAFNPIPNSWLQQIILLKHFVKNLFLKFFLCFKVFKYIAKKLLWKQLYIYLNICTFNTFPSFVVNFYNDDQYGH